LGKFWLVSLEGRADDGDANVGESLLDEYQRFVAARARPKTVLA
jgi:hypothetical protein